MLRCMGRTPEGKRFYLMGITRENVRRMDAGEPISFAADGELAGHHFLIASVPAGKTPAHTAEIKRRMGLGAETKLHALFFPAGMLALMIGGELELPAEAIELPMDCLLCVTETYAELGERIGVDGLMQPKPNEQVRLNRFGQLVTARRDN